MRIGRKDAQPQPDDDRPVEGASPPPKGAAKEFDWSKVRAMPGQPGQEKVLKGKKEKKKKAEDAPPEAAAEEKSLAARIPLSRNEKMIAGGIALLLTAIVYFAFVRGDPGLAPALTVSQEKQMEQESKKEMIDSYSELEKKYGADHPEVIQQREMMRQLGVQGGK